MIHNFSNCFFLHRLPLQLERQSRLIFCICNNNLYIRYLKYAHLTPKPSRVREDMTPNN